MRVTTETIASSMLAIAEFLAAAAEDVAQHGGLTLQSYINGAFLAIQLSIRLKAPKETEPKNISDAGEKKDGDTRKLQRFSARFCCFL